MIINVTDKRGIILKTAGKYCTEDIVISPALETKKVTANGTYAPSDGYSGIGEVIVEAPVHDIFPNAEGVSF